ncbi:unnamed protein product, partial [Meganyctiphanes norvegica]
MRVIFTLLVMVHLSFATHDAREGLETGEDIGAWDDLVSNEGLVTRRDLDAREHLGTRQNLDAGNKGTRQNLDVSEHLDTSQNLDAGEYIGTRQDLDAREYLGTRQNLDAREYLGTNKGLVTRVRRSADRNFICSPRDVKKVLTLVCGLHKRSDDDGQRSKITEWLLHKRYSMVLPDELDWSPTNNRQLDSQSSSNEMRHAQKFQGKVEPKENIEGLENFSNDLEAFSNLGWREKRNIKRKRDPIFSERMKEKTIDLDDLRRIYENKSNIENP